jgi:hypothetical protein
VAPKTVVNLRPNYAEANTRERLAAAELQFGNVLEEGREVERAIAELDAQQEHVGEDEELVWRLAGEWEVIRGRAKAFAERARIAGRQRSALRAEGTRLEKLAIEHTNGATLSEAFARTFGAPAGERARSNWQTDFDPDAPKGRA